jgi:hypothetical protein
MLREGNEALRSALEGVGEEEAQIVPAEGRWSAAECVEHLALAEAELLRLIKIATKAGTTPARPGLEEKIRVRAADRSFRIEAPEVAVPSGRSESLHEAAARFDAARAETLAWVASFAADPRKWVTTHPLMKGPVNCWEMLLMIALHPKRHAEQIREIREGLPH